LRYEEITLARWIGSESAARLRYLFGKFSHHCNAEPLTSDETRNFNIKSDNRNAAMVVVLMLMFTE